MNKQYRTLAFAYVGIIVGAGLSSGQDILQYLLAFGIPGFAGVLLLAVLNIVFAKIILSLGCYYQADNHSEVLEQITHPVMHRFIDGVIVFSSFVMGFVMIAGAGANLNQVLDIPTWCGSVFCAALVIVVAFLDFNRITQALGIFTPIAIVMIVLIAAYSLTLGPFDFAALDEAARTITPAIPNVWLAAVNYFTICALAGVSMAFVLGGSVVRIGMAEKGGMVGGALIGTIVILASVALFLNIIDVKDSNMPMLQIVENIHPILAMIYATVIFALIFNTAFSLFYSSAKRFSPKDDRKMRLILIGLVLAGLVCSFGGFRNLIGIMYPILGYVGLILLVVLIVAWIREKDNIAKEKHIRRSMLFLSILKHHEDYEYTERHEELFDKLGDASVADTEAIQKSVDELGKEIVEKVDDIGSIVDKHMDTVEKKLEESEEEKDEEPE